MPFLCETGGCPAPAQSLYSALVKSVELPTVSRASLGPSPSTGTGRSPWDALRDAGFGDGIPSFAWESPDGTCLAARGVAAAWTGEGPDRFERARTWASSAIPSASASGSDDIEAVFVGGFAFGSTPRPGDCLPNAALWLPESLWIRRPDQPMREIARERGSKSAAHPLRSGAPFSRSAGRDWSPREWRNAVEAALLLIEGGQLEKVVLARSRAIAGSRAWDPASIFEALRSAFPECFHFYCDDGRGRVFLGASPERLVSLHDGWVEADAMAGTARRDPRDPEDAVVARALHSDPKERHEHAVVVREIVAALRARSVDATAPAEPSVARFRHLLHLRTKVHGSAPSGAHVLDLVSSLHPTPAVAGTPASAAMEFILAREPRPRGWYAGPIGWMDRAGNGEFSVGLRSALLDGDRALLIAGAGIVSGSDPEREWNECESKMAFLEEILTRG